jgi:hypothetical protein
MKRILQTFFVLCFFVLIPFRIFSQSYSFAIIYYKDEDDLSTIYLHGYDFARMRESTIWMCDTIVVRTLEEKIQQLTYDDRDTISYAPDVRRQVILENNKGFYKVVSYNSTSMELGGRLVNFNKKLFDYVEYIIETCEKHYPHAKEIFIWKKNTIFAP